MSRQHIDTFLENVMPHVYEAVLTLETKPKAGDGDCVDLIKQYVTSLKSRSTFSWRPGEKVMNSQNLKRGTVIATFLCRHYPQGSKRPNKHVALFVRYDGPRDKNGAYSRIVVMDQWKSNVSKPKISSRFISSHGMSGATCSMTDNGVSNNLDVYYVVE
jgi:hypothetical protein